MRYKNEGVDSKELRRRREEEGIQLRKQKRDIQLFKRRNINETIQNDEADVSMIYSVCLNEHKRTLIININIGTSFGNVRLG